MVLRRSQVGLDFEGLSSWGWARRLAEFEVFCDRTWFVIGLIDLKSLWSSGSSSLVAVLQLRKTLWAVSSVDYPLTNKDQMGERTVMISDQGEAFQVRYLYGKRPPTVTDQKAGGLIKHGLKWRNLWSVGVPMIISFSNIELCKRF